MTYNTACGGSRPEQMHSHPNCLRTGRGLLRTIGSLESSSATVTKSWLSTHDKKPRQNIVRLANAHTTGLILYSGAFAASAKELYCKLFAHARSTWPKILLKLTTPVVLMLMSLTRRICVSSLLTLLFKTFFSNLNPILNPMPSPNRLRLTLMFLSSFESKHSTAGCPPGVLSIFEAVVSLVSQDTRAFVKKCQKIKTEVVFTCLKFIGSCFRHRWDPTKQKYAFEIAQCVPKFNAIVGRWTFYSVLS